MSWKVTFYIRRLEEQILQLPAGFLARFVRYAERVESMAPTWACQTADGGRHEMSKSLKQFKARALARPDVKDEYDSAAAEFEFLDEILKARADAGLTQADVAARIGTTQSAVARLESADAKHSPSIATLQRYASALGCTLQVRLVKGPRPVTRPTRTTRRRAAG